MNKKSFNHMILACLFVFAGILLLLVNLGVISLEIKKFIVDFYPVLIIVIGFKWLLESLFNREAKWFISIFLIFFGTLLCLDRIGILTFHFMMFWKLWPLIFIWIGLKLLGRIFRKSNKNQIYEENSPSFKNIIGDVKFDEPNWPVEPMDIRTMIADLHFDFSRAYIPDHNTEIKINSLVGDIKMLIPEDIPIKVDAYVKIGDILVFGKNADGFVRHFSYISDGYDEATRKLTIIIRHKIGSIRIDKV